MWLLDAVVVMETAPRLRVAVSVAEREPAWLLDAVVVIDTAPRLLVAVSVADTETRCVRVAVPVTDTACVRVAVSVAEAVPRGTCAPTDVMLASITNSLYRLNIVLYV